MAVAVVEEVILKHGSCEGPNIAADGSRTYRETWMLRTDTPVDDFGDDQALLKSAIVKGLPARGTTFRSDEGAICVTYSPKQDDDARTVWWIGITYDSKAEAWYAVELDEQFANDYAIVLRQVPFHFESEAYRCDFMVVEQDELGHPMWPRFIDVKGHMTATSRRKIRAVKKKFGVDIEIVPAKDVLRRHRGERLP